jgi:diketogulonate reductase-like aldo/keto reductase
VNFVAIDSAIVSEFTGTLAVSLYRLFNLSERARAAGDPQTRTLRATPSDVSTRRLGFDYADLYLLHWPVAGKRLDSWRALEKLHAEGRARAIGVSNFLVPHLEELLAHASLPPSVNQIEVHPFLRQCETRAFCEAQRIVVAAYSPLTHGTLMDHAVITSNAQVPAPVATPSRARH